MAIAATMTQPARTMDCNQMTDGSSDPSQRNATQLLPNMTVDSRTQSSTIPSCQ